MFSLKYEKTRQINPKKEGNNKDEKIKEIQKELQAGLIKSQIGLLS